MTLSFLNTLSDKWAGGRDGDSVDKHDGWNHWPIHYNVSIWQYHREVKWTLAFNRGSKKMIAALRVCVYAPTIRYHMNQFLFNSNIKNICQKQLRRTKTPNVLPNNKSHWEIKHSHAHTMHTKAHTQRRERDHARFSLLKQNNWYLLLGSHVDTNI